MKKKITKITVPLVLGTVIVTSITGCKNHIENSSDDSMSITNKTIEEITEITENNANENLETNSFTPDNTKIESENDETGTQLADLSFLFGSPNRIEVYTRNYNIVTKESADVELFHADVDIIDTGSSYLLGVSKIIYYLGVTNYGDFIETAVEPDGNTVDENGKTIYNYKIVKGKEQLTCFGETFTLVSYYTNDNGRGFCEFIGDDSKKYYINNDISFLCDDFTGETYFKLEQEDGQEAYREISFDEKTYIEIPYDKAKGTGIESFLTRSPDISSGEPGGLYYIQVDNEGNIVKFQNPFT